MVPAVKPRISLEDMPTASRRKEHGPAPPVASIATAVLESPPNRPTKDVPEVEHEEPVDSGRESSRGSGLAAQLLEGLSFSTRVLGIGSYGIVIKGTLCGMDVAVKFMVTSRCADRTVVREVALGASPALTHPHICKAYDTRCAVMTNALFDELERHREQRQRRQERQRQLLQQGPGSHAAAATCRPGSSKSNGQRGGRAAAGRSPTARRRVLLFPTAVPGEYNSQPQVNRLQPLESCSPLGALHEVLFRLGASVGQTVTLVVMEHCCKGTLARAIHRGIFAPCDLWSKRVARRALVRTVAEVARALLHLHKAGVVHGDLKPGNVLLKSSREDRRGFTAKVGDFGLSHVLPEGAKSLDTDTWGTPAYMAPEALLGHASKSSDVWSFGVMLSEALTRSRPYGGDIEPARLVLGIIDNSLKLSWPEVPDISISGLCIGGGAAGAATAARLAHHYGLAFPTNSSKGIAANATGCNDNSINATSTVVSLDCGYQTGTNMTSTMTTTMLTTATYMQGSACASVAGGSDGGGCNAAAGVGVAAASGGVEGADDDIDAVLACLVSLGRRCTSPEPADRPCFSEILGELIDMEIIMKTPRHRGGKDAQEAGERARSRMALNPGTEPAASETAAKVEAPAAPPKPPSLPQRVMQDFLQSVAAQQAAMMAAQQAMVAAAAAAGDAAAEGGLVAPPPAQQEQEQPEAVEEQAPPPLQPQQGEVAPLHAVRAAPLDSGGTRLRGPEPPTPDVSDRLQLLVEGYQGRRQSEGPEGP